MADMPAYLQGTQTGNALFGNLPPQSSIPSIDYSGLNAAIMAAAPYGQGAINQAVADYNAGTSSYNAPQQNSFDANNMGQGTGMLSVVGSGQTAQATEPADPPNDGTFTAVGQSEAWLSPAELAARTAAATTAGHAAALGGGQHGGGGSSSGTSASTSAGSGGVLSGLGTAANGLNNNTSPNFSSLQPTSLQSVNYQSPQGSGSVYTGGPSGYQTPGTSEGAQGGAGTLAMNQANPQNAFNQYQGSLGYQMLGNDQTNQYEQSPGYQYAVNEALRQVQGGASSRGLLESGSVMRAMTDRAQGMAQQDYGNWWNRQNQLYGDYQNRLQGLAGGDTGSQNAMTLGQNLGANAQATASNLGSLFGNQSTSGLGAYTNTGAAQANGMQQAANTQLQTNSANTSTLLAGAMLNKGSF